MFLYKHPCAVPGLGKDTNHFSHYTAVLFACVWLRLLYEYPARDEYTLSHQEKHRTLIPWKEDKVQAWRIRMKVI